MATAVIGKTEVTIGLRVRKSLDLHFRSMARLSAAFRAALRIRNTEEFRDITVTASSGVVTTDVNEDRSDLTDL